MYFNTLRFCVWIIQVKLTINQIIVFIFQETDFEIIP